MTGLIIINGFFRNPNNEYKARRLREEFAKAGVRVDTLSALDLLTATTGDSLAMPVLDAYDFAIDLDKDGYLADAVSQRMPMFNSALSLHLSDDKMTTLLMLSDSGIRCPLTISSPLCYVSSPSWEAMKVFLDQVEARLGYPMVFKENHGSMGRQVALIHDRQELERTYLRNCHVPHLYERFLAKHAGHDFRIMVVGGKAVAVMERVNETDFRSNIALGGKGYDAWDSVPDSFKALAEKATGILHLDYAGIDVAMDDDGEPMLLEANGNAFFTEIEKITGVNITKALVDHILKTLNGN